MLMFRQHSQFKTTGMRGALWIFYKIQSKDKGKDNNDSKNEKLAVGRN